MKNADVKTIVAKFESELKAKCAEVKTVYAVFNGWCKYGKNRTYIDVKVEVEHGKILSYKAGFINNDTNRYNAKLVAVNIQKKDFASICNELDERREDKNGISVEEVEDLEKIAETEKGTVVIVKRNGCYCAMMQNGNTLKKLTYFSCFTGGRLIAGSDARNYLQDENIEITDEIEEALDGEKHREEIEKKEEEERKAQERKVAESAEVVGKTAEGEMVIVEKDGKFEAKIRTPDCKLKYVPFAEKRERKIDALYDAYNFYDDNNLEIPENLVKEFW